MVGGLHHRYARISLSVGTGFGDLMVDAKMSIYDYLAAVPMIEGAGDIMTDWQGNPITLESGVRVLAVTHTRLHEQAIRLEDQLDHPLRPVNGAVGRIAGGIGRDLCRLAGRLSTVFPLQFR